MASCRKVTHFAVLIVCTGKLTIQRYPESRGILCAGPTTIPSGYDPKRFVTCGKFTSENEVILFKDIRMIKE